MWLENSYLEEEKDMQNLDLWEHVGYVKFLFLCLFLFVF